MTEAPEKRPAATVQLSERVHAMLAGVNCAIVRLADDRAMLIDSGQDKEHGRKLRKALDELGLTLSVILCSHSHADHYGGNAYLLRQYPDARIWAPELEAEVIRAPQLEPIYLFHGAAPLRELTSKWLQAEASPVHEVVAAGSYSVGGVSFELLDVRGHAHRQLAVLVDDVLVAADAVFGSETLDKYPLPFVQDVAGQLSSFGIVEATTASLLLPGHGRPTADAKAIAAANRDVVERAAAAILAACPRHGGASLDDVAVEAGAQLGIVISDIARYYLNNCAVAAHLSHLRAAGKAECAVTGNRLLWRQA